MIVDVHQSGDALARRRSILRALLQSGAGEIADDLGAVLVAARLRRSVDLGDFVTRPATARLMDEPAGLWPRNPPIRHRANIPTAWIELTISEGKNRQVRRMTAKIGFPTLRLIRAAVGEWTLGTLQPGEWKELHV